MKHYVPLTVQLNEVCGVLWAMRAMRLPKRSESDTLKFGSSPAVIGPGDADLAGRLIRAGNDHAKAMRGVVAYLRMNFQVGFMIEFETYRIGAEVLSTSSAMHMELKQLTGPELADQKQADLPDKIYTRDIMLSYQTLRSMYKARRKHRHPDWQIFCDFIETLPHFDILILPEGRR